VIATLSMPIILTREMTPNGRQGWRKHAQTVKRLREDAYRATMSYVNDPSWRSAQGWDVLGCGDSGEPVTMDLEVEWPKGRKTMDEDNIVAALKPVRDGIADALWGGEDKHVRVGSVTQTRGAGGLRITLRSGNDV
jgi:hypothetical protein